MGFYLIIFIILIAIFIGLLFWVYKLYKLYKKGKKKSFAIQALVLTTIIVFVTWQLQLFPFSKNVYIKNRTSELTGQSFWSWEEFDYEEISVRGEGYSLDIYKFNEDTADYFKNPDNAFFENFPPDELSDKKWTKTPIKESEKEILEFVTPIYGSWEGEIVDRQEFIREIANEPGAYYSYSHGGSKNFYLIALDKRLVILINHNM